MYIHVHVHVLNCGRALCLEWLRCVVASSSTTVSFFLKHVHVHVHAIHVHYNMTTCTCMVVLYVVYVLCPQTEGIRCLVERRQ